MEAEKKLLMAQNEHGAYLIRDSESRRNDYSLSVRDGDTVKHYRIRPLDDGGFFIARRTTFRTLQELVEHYSRDADGLCVNLRKTCVQVKNKPTTAKGYTKIPLYSTNSKLVSRLSLWCCCRCNRVSFRRYVRCYICNFLATISSRSSKCVVLYIYFFLDVSDVTFFFVRSMNSLLNSMLAVTGSLCCPWEVEHYACRL